MKEIGKYLNEAFPRTIDRAETVESANILAACHLDVSLCTLIAPSSAIPHVKIVQPAMCSVVNRTGFSGFVDEPDELEAGGARRSLLSSTTSEVAIILYRNAVIGISLLDSSFTVET